MKPRKVFAATIAVALAAGGSLTALLTLAPAASGAASAPSRPVLKEAYTGTIDSLNPYIAIYQNSDDVLNLEYEALTTWGWNNSETGQLAASWSTSADGKTWIYKLHPGMKWSDGQPLTSADVVWTIEAAMKNSALQAANGSLIASVASVSAPDPDTVEVTTKARQAPDPVLGLWIVPKHIWSKVPDPAKFADVTNVVGSGPYILKSYSQNQYATMTVNPHWHGGTPPLGGVDFISYKDANAAVAGLQSGDIDEVSDLTPLQYNALKGKAGISVAEPLSEHYWSLDVNPGATTVHGQPMGNGNPVLHDPVVRQAIQGAIDDKTLVTKVLDGFGSYGPGIVPPAYQTWYMPNSDMRPFSIAAANQMLDKAGYKRGPGGIRLDPRTGKPITLRLGWVTSYTLQQQTVSYVIPWLQRLGFKITSLPMSEDQSAQDLTLGNYDILFDGWGEGPDPDYMLYINTCGSRPSNANGGGNTSAYNWCDPAFDKYFNAQHVQLDKARRAADVHSALSLLYKAGVVDVLFYDAPLDAYRSSKFVIPHIRTNGIGGYYAFTMLRPVAQASGSSSGSSGGSWYVWVIVAAAVVVVAGGGAAVAPRRRLAGDTE